MRIVAFLDSRSPNARFGIRTSGLLASLLLLTSLVPAQSGRRLPNRGESPPPPIVTPRVPESTTATKSDQPQTKIHLATSTAFSGYESFYSGIVVKACAERLKNSYATISVGRDMNRKEASDFAKSTKDTFVLWLELSEDRMGSRTNQRYREDFVITFTVFVPGTGKSKTSGRVYQSDQRGRVGVGGTGIPIPTPGGPGASEYALRECGYEIAKRVIDSLGVGRPERFE